MREISPLDLPDLKPADLPPYRPVFKTVPIKKMRVDERYQRDPTNRSINLIKKIVKEWDWSAFKPPVVVEVNNVYHVIDGQHTAIAAATHGGFVELPVMLVKADSVAKRADAFVRQNRDRTATTRTQLHYAMLAAGDEDALTIQQVCDRAGVKILRITATNARYKVGETIAVSAIEKLIARRYALGARKVLEICVKAGCAPITVTYIRAVECLLYDAEYKGKYSEDKLIDLIKNNAPRLQDETERFAAEHHVEKWRALASVINMKHRGRHG